MNGYDLQFRRRESRGTRRASFRRAVGGPRRAHTTDRSFSAEEGRGRGGGGSWRGGGAGTRPPSCSELLLMIC